MRQVIVRSLVFISGFIFMSVLLVGLMKVMHQDVIFLNSLKLARQIGAARKIPQPVFDVEIIYRALWRSPVGFHSGPGSIMELFCHLEKTES